MESFLTQSNISFVISIMAVIFGVYLYFKKPQIDSEKKDALLEQRVQWEKESNDKKFSDFSARLDNSMTLAQNHIHTVDTKVDALISSMNSMSNEITRLTTIIEERIPKK